MRSFLLILLLTAIAAGIAWTVSRPEPVAVIAVPITKGRVEATVSNTRAGTVKACRRSRLAPATGGQVAQLPVHEGDRVKQGDLLMVIWNEDLAAQVKLAQSEAAAADARSREACLTADVAEREAARLRKLRAKNVVSEERVDRANTDALARRAACRAGRAAVDVGRAQVAASRAMLDRTILRAPFGGVIAEINAELGEFVTPSPPGIPTPPAVDLIDDSCVYMTAPIDEVDVTAVRPGLSACVTLDAYPEPLCGARVRRVAPYVFDREKQARTVEVEVEFQSPEQSHGLLPGLSADVEIQLESRDDVLRIPTEAVLEGNRVLLYRPADQRLEERHFEAGISNWRHTEVRSGLKTGEQIVTSVDREGVRAEALATLENTAASRAKP